MQKEHIKQTKHIKQNTSNLLATCKTLLAPTVGFGPSTIHVWVHVFVPLSQMPKEGSALCHTSAKWARNGVFARYCARMFLWVRCGKILTRCAPPAANFVPSKYSFDWTPTRPTERKSRLIGRDDDLL